VTEVADDEDDGEDEPAATFRTSIDLYNFSHQRQLPPSAQRCSQTACWNAAEIQGMCLQHYYDYCKSFTAGSGIPTPRRASIAAGWDATRAGFRFWFPRVLTQSDAVRRTQLRPLRLSCR
jgi:hypothetical protein